LLASKSTQLQNLLRYISQIQQHMETEWRSSQDLPSKFIRNINETLKEKLDSDLVDAAYHLVISGNCSDPMKEWLIDELTERVRLFYPSRSYGRMKSTNLSGAGS
jgi:anaphase-promoting complex subunit 4